MTEAQYLNFYCWYYTDKTKTFIQAWWALSTDQFAATSSHPNA